jgi:hypothetical protein
MDMTVFSKYDLTTSPDNDIIIFLKLIDVSINTNVIMALLLDAKVNHGNADKFKSNDLFVINVK